MSDPVLANEVHKLRVCMDRIAYALETLVLIQANGVGFFSTSKGQQTTQAMVNEITARTSDIGGKTT